MAEKKETTHGVKGFVARSLESSRNRAGYKFSSTKSYIDVEGDDLSDEEVKEIESDPYLVTVPVDSQPKGVDRLQRYDEHGVPTTGEKRASALKKEKAEGAPGAPLLTDSRTGTLEVATEEMLDAAKRGEPIPAHPSSPGGTVGMARTNESPEAARERLRQLDEKFGGDDDEPASKKSKK
jgi:hypothetical protein